MVSSPKRASPTSRWVSMSAVSMDEASSDQEISTGGTGTGVQTIVKDVIKEMTVVSALVVREGGGVSNVACRCCFWRNAGVVFFTKAWPR